MATDFYDLELAFGARTYSKRRLNIVRGDGCWVWDADGKRYLDCLAGIGAASLGHRHPRLVRAIQAQADTIISAPEYVCNPVRAEYQKRLVSHLPDGFDRVFLCNSGAEAIEGALKFARLATGKPGAIAFKRAYHGKTMGALSATFEPKYREPFFPLLDGFVHCAPDASSLETTLASNTNVGAVVFEAIQGEGGVRALGLDFICEATKLAHAHGAVVIADEVQCGFGRTGKMWGFGPSIPDLIASSKGIAGGVPMGAIGISTRIPELPALSHTSTFGGNPLSCAAGHAVLDAIEHDGIIENAANVGEFLARSIESAGLKRVREVRGFGLMIGIELKEHAGPFLQPCADRGLIVLLAGQRVIRLLPPLVMSLDEAKFAAETLIEVLR
ncbi:MAG TPA: aminotransferase class III-fold pyridoxal phosphate-dependent enzyme [Fimbriimonadaceae bacterium]|nr:aminotransferase class III-fold pyridoxal phosphate-dependent enzyme [Fimbriimonadaceae bacterium]